MNLTRCDVERTDFVAFAVVFDGWEGTAGCDQCFAFGPFDDVFRLGFVEACWIAQRENHGAVDVLGHLPYYPFRKGLRNGRCSNEDMRLHFFHYCEQIVMFLPLPFVVIAGIEFLRGRKTVAVRFE